MSRDIANQFRMLALEAFATASEMSDPECRRTMQQIATAYETLADRLPLALGSIGDPARGRPHGADLLIR
jgi:hypothetical protein